MARSTRYSDWTDEEFKTTAKLMGRLDWEAFKAECLAIEQAKDQLKVQETSLREAQKAEFFRGISTDELIAECELRGLIVKIG